MSATKTIAENLLQELADAGDAAARCELGSRLSSDVGVGHTASTKETTSTDAGRSAHDHAPE